MENPTFQKQFLRRHIQLLTQEIKKLDNLPEEQKQNIDFVKQRNKHVIDKLMSQQALENIEKKNKK
jgi:hypothetical protein